ncbi:MAG: ELM1/GtrOC1 family putative glycosyltransferase [Candidatus Omnitrophica bacterium]|nr:ELM1/GtrOC1 family putative glycosyltransferase [Candidatus Omnitrophota bacterium]MDD5690227.1 ELM1/GtrOC1 family putative glycosyltransferase [Candidatus Omnitrophota bacterium]
MKQNLIADYLSCILFKAASLFTFLLPLNASLFLGRRLGDVIYFFDSRHRAVAYANIKKAVTINKDFRLAAKITRKVYQAFGQNLIEISFIPRINKRYLEKYIHIENRHYIGEAFKRGKGVIFLIAHEGNWELSNIICANLGFPFILFVRDQGFPRLNDLLNTYRLKQGAKLIHKQGGLRELIDVLKNNQSIGMTTDQGGKKGEIVRFFGKSASMSTGAVKLALKYGCSIIPVFYTRVKGPHTKVILDQVYVATKSGDAQNDLHDNLQRLADIYEKYIQQYPYEYLWTYKIWKYGKEKEVLILSDGKAGHLHQSESVAKLVNRQLSGRGIKSTLSICEVKFRSCLFRVIFNWMAVFNGRYQCHRCLCYLHYALTSESWQGLINLKPDIIISAGDKLSAVNYILAKANQAKSVIVMRPAVLSLKKFDLAIIPRHDRPQNKKNVVMTEGALNLIDGDYLKEKSGRLQKSGLLKGPLLNPCIGILIGGDSKGFAISRQAITGLIGQIKQSAEELNADILLSTSRRTPPEVEQVLKKEFEAYLRCKLLIIANENNHPDAVGGILGLSSIIISSPESISMISEAVMAERYVVVFKAAGLSKKHQRFLKNYQDKRYIYLKQIKEISGFIREILQNHPRVSFPEDNLRVSAGLDKIL